MAQVSICNVYFSCIPGRASRPPWAGINPRDERLAAIADRCRPPADCLSALLHFYND
jgi:hypothetical protein